MRVAAVQLCSGTDVTENIESASGLIRKAAQQGATFIATPEMTHVLNKDPKSLFETLTTEDQDRGVRAFADLAKELSISLLIGSLAIKVADRRAVNRSYLFGPDGKKRARYDKIHLFDVKVSDRETWTESRIYDRGDRAIIADVNGAKVGLSICYDVRFPALYRGYAQRGAQILTVPAAFTRPTGEAHWETLLTARAIETGSFVIAPAQGGEHADGRATWGHSMILDPWGVKLGKLDHDRPDILLADLDLSHVARARARIPAWQSNPHFEFVTVSHAHD